MKADPPMKTGGTLEEKEAIGTSAAIPATNGAVVESLSQLHNPKCVLAFSCVFNPDVVPEANFAVFCHLPGSCQTANTDTLLHTGLFMSQISSLRCLWSRPTVEKVFF